MVSPRVRGFTIVELLIVIVVIAILAAISIVAYTGIQDRSKYASATSGLSQIKKSLELYNAQEGSYPYTGVEGSRGWRYYCNYISNPSNFIPALSAVTPTIPAAPCSAEGNTNDTWLYASDGVDYKLLHLRANASGNYRQNIPLEMRDTRWSDTNTTWGYWTPAAVSW